MAHFLSVATFLLFVRIALDLPTVPRLCTLLRQMTSVRSIQSVVPHVLMGAGSSDIQLNQLSRSPYTQVCAMTIRAKNQATIVATRKFRLQYLLCYLQQGLIQGVPKDGPAQENSARR